MKRLTILLAFALILVGGCVQRTGTFFADTRFSLSGPVILVNGVSMWGSGPKRDAFSAMLGSALTTKLFFFSWWWDTLCLPYDVYLRFNGIDFYVYDQDGNPIPGARIKGHGEASFCGMDEVTDKNGHAYFSRRVTGFTHLCAEKDGYFGCRALSTFWCSHHTGDGLPQMFRPEHGGRAANISTSNTEHSVNMYVKEIPVIMPNCKRFEFVLSNLVAEVEYDVDLREMELCEPYGSGSSRDIKVCLHDDKISRGRVRGALDFETPNSGFLAQERDGCEKWGYLYYEPPEDSFSKVRIANSKITPSILALSSAASKKREYALLTSCSINYWRKQEEPWVLRLSYWIVEPTSSSSIVCDSECPKVVKLSIPSSNNSNQKPKK